MIWAIALALWGALAGDVAVLVAALTEAMQRTTMVAGALGCSVIAAAALGELAQSVDRRRRGVVRLLIVGHAVAAALVLAELVPDVPSSLLGAGVGVAVASGVISLAAIRPLPPALPARPLLTAPRVAAIALIAQPLVILSADRAVLTSGPIQLAFLVAIVAPAPSRWRACRSSRCASVLCA